LTLGLALHELATNAARHGALKSPSGRIEIRSQLKAATDSRGRAALVWRERDGPPIESPGTRGFGVTMIERGLAYQLDGTAALEFRREGLHCTIEFPLDRCVAPAEGKEWSGDRAFDGVG
jgi:two-component sensor histidine kinase